MNEKIHKNVAKIDFASSQYSSVRLIPYFLYADQPMFGFPISKSGTIVTIGGSVEPEDYNCYESLLRELKEETGDYLSVDIDNILSSFAIEKQDILTLITPVSYPGLKDFVANDEINDFLWLSLEQLKKLAADSEKRIREPKYGQSYLFFSPHVTRAISALEKLPLLQARYPIDNETISLPRSAMTSLPLSQGRLEDLKEALKNKKINPGSIMIASTPAGLVIYHRNDENKYYFASVDREGRFNQLFREILQTIERHFLEGASSMNWYNAFFTIDDRPNNLLPGAFSNLRRAANQLHAHNPAVKQLRARYVNLVKKDISHLSYAERKEHWEQIARTLIDIENKLYELRSNSTTDVSAVRQEVLKIIKIVNEACLTNTDYLEKIEISSPENGLDYLEHLKSRKLWYNNHGKLSIVKIE